MGAWAELMVANDDPSGSTGTPRAPGASGSGSGSTGASLRSVAFAVTVLGALLIGIGAILTWVTVVAPVGGGEGVLDRVYRGVDLLGGIVALVVAADLLVGIVVLPRLPFGRARLVMGGLMIVAGLLALAFAGATALTADPRFIEYPGDEIAIGTGVWLTMAGGAIGAVGGLLALAWASRRPAASPESAQPESA